MAKKKAKALMKLVGTLALVGGAVHVLAPLGVDVLGWFAGVADYVQVVAGASGVYVGYQVLTK